MPEVETGRNGRARRGEEPHRRCIVTRQSLPAGALIRFVAGPDGRVVPDLRARLPGRGAWVRADADTVGAAARKGHFARALKCGGVSVPEDLADSVGRLLRDRTLEALGMASRQGALLSGRVKVEQALRAGRLGIVLFASDGAADSRRKLESALAAAPGKAPEVFDGFSSDQMSLATGRANVIHAGVVRGRAAAAVEAALTRLLGYRGGGAVSGSGAC